MKKGIVYTSRRQEGGDVIMPIQGYLIGNYGVYKDTTYCNMWCVIDVYSGLGVKYYSKLRDVYDVINSPSGMREWDENVKKVQNSDRYIEYHHKMQVYKSEHNI